MEQSLDFKYGTLGPLFGPPEPQNLWSVIRVNHGVQTSREFLVEAIKDLDIDLTIEIDSSIHGNPADRYNELLQNPTTKVISMVPEVGRGHAVTPYLAESTQIHVYDNNDPLDDSRNIGVSLQDNRYSFPRPSRNETWRGKALFTIPLDVWRNERHAPLDIGDFLDGSFLMSLVFGDADALYTSSGGEQWGWTEEGTFVDEMPGAHTLSLFGSADEAVLNAPLILPMEKGELEIQLNSRGGDYIFFAGEGGQTLQVENQNSTEGETDRIGMDYIADTLSGFRFTPESKASDILPKVGLDIGERQRALFRWWQLEAEAGGTVGFVAMRDEVAAEYINESGAETTHYLVVDAVDGEAEVYGTHTFGPFTIPAGAHHRTTLVSFPDSTRLLSELDLDGDGTYESSTVVFGLECASMDNDGNGMPDLCEDPSTLEFRTFLPAIVE